MTHYNTLDEVLVARNHSTRAIHYIEAEQTERIFSLGQLYNRALGLLRHLQARGASPQDEIMLLLESNEQFIDAFWACMLGNMIAVPLAPGINDEHRWKFFRVLRQLRRPHLCTDAKSLARLKVFAQANNVERELEKLQSATLVLDQVDDVSQPGTAQVAQADDIAFIQYSSGSTSEPKGVALTHRNLLTNIAAIIQGSAIGPQDSTLSWMPLTHDMGLIGFHLTPLVADIDQYLIPTALFVRRPQLWLSKASEKRATLLCSPNFGYRHFLKTWKPEKSAPLDLSPVRLLFNGAEPISVDLCTEFLTAMASSGLVVKTMFPVYGLAEASLAVAFPPPGTPYQTLTVNRGTLSIGAIVEPVNPDHAHAITLVSVGQPVDGCTVRIAGAEDQALPENTIGRILIRGENVTRGYYQSPRTTHDVINKDGWLDTGDLGFISAHGLVVTGRLKDILFVSGQNYYPQDLETVLDQHAGIELGKAAVCGVRPEQAEADEIIAFVLYRGAWADFIPIISRVRKTINEHIGIVIDQVIPVGKIPKTTSGKIQRYLLAQAYQAGEFKGVLQELENLSAANTSVADSTHSEIERILKEICDTFIKDKAIGTHDNIFELGTSSLTLAQIYQRIDALYPGQIEITDFFDYPTIAELAKYLESRLQSAHA